MLTEIHIRIIIKINLREHENVIEVKEKINKDVEGRKYTFQEDCIDDEFHSGEDLNPC